MPRTNFSPFIHGFKFANYFKNTLANIPGFGKVETYGRCGGMAYTALDYYFGGLAVPLAGDLPADGVPLADYIFERQVLSFTSPSAINFIAWSLYADEPTWFFKGLSQATRQDEFPKLKSQLDLGHPQVLGLISARDIGHIGDNHQVVACGYEIDDTSGKVSVFIYDVNTPDTETVLTLVPGGIGVQASNRTDPWRGFFVHGYGPMWPHYLIDGTLVKEHSRGEIYAIYRGGKLLIPDKKEFKAMGYSQARIQDVNDGALTFVSDAPGDGTVLQERGHSDFYVVYGGAKFHIADETIFDSLSLLKGNVKTVPSGSLAGVPDLPREGSLIREMDDGPVFVIRGGMRHQIPNVQDLSKLGFIWNNIRVVPDGDLTSIPDGGLLF
jgi:hypothetical protein